MLCDTGAVTSDLTRDTPASDFRFPKSDTLLVPGLDLVTGHPVRCLYFAAHTFGAPATGEIAGPCQRLDMPVPFTLTRDKRTAALTPCRMRLGQFKDFLVWCADRIEEITHSEVNTTVRFKATNGVDVYARPLELDSENDLLPSNLNRPGITLVSVGVVGGVERSIAITFFAAWFGDIVHRFYADVSIEGNNVAVSDLLARIKNKVRHHRTWYSYLRWPVTVSLVISWLLISQLLNPTHQYPMPFYVFVLLIISGVAIVCYTNAFLPVIPTFVVTVREPALKVPWGKWGQVIAGAGTLAGVLVAVADYLRNNHVK
jgi:hypothetical protein